LKHIETLKKTCTDETRVISILGTCLWRWWWRFICTSRM